MENLKKAMIIRGGNVIGAVGDKYFSTAPIGTVLAYAGNEAPRGYLLADGASYAVADYPDLYAVIGNTYGGDTDNFNVPDYRETVLVGVGENTTDTIASHDVYELGEFKDDQLQDHTHTIQTGTNNTSGRYINQMSTYSNAEYTTTSSQINNGRKGTTTHGKQKGVTYIIKAFHTNEGVDAGVSDDVVEYVDRKINDSEIQTNSTWSSSKINEELEDVRGELDIIVEEANKNTTINDEATSLTTTWSSKKTSDELGKKQDNLSVRKVYARRNSSANKYILLSTIDMSKITYIGQPIRIKGVIGNMASDITNIDLVINARNGFVKKILSGTVTHKNFLTNDANIIITKSDDEKTAYVYLYCISTYGYIDAEIYLGSVHYSVPSTFDLVETMQGTEYTSLLDSNYVVIENVINDTTSSETSTYSSAKIDTELAKKESVYTTNTPANLLYHAAQYLGEDPAQYKLYNVTIVDDKGNFGEFNFVYKQATLIYGYIISENGITLAGINNTGTLAVNSTSSYRNYRVKYLGIPTEDMTAMPNGGYTRANKNALVSDINPTIDRTDLFPSNELDLNLLYNRCGTGVYDIVGQGSAGHGMIRADLWAINNGTICYIVSIMYSDGSSSTVGGNINAQPTVPINSKWMSVINKLTKIGYL